MTEDDARSRWCPFVRYNLNRQEDGKYQAPNGDLTLCIASDCMAWRWGNDIGEIPEWGYCGLAGKC